MPRYVINPGNSQKLEAPVARIDVQVGDVTVSQFPEASELQILHEGDAIDVPNEAGITLLSAQGAAVYVTYEHDAEAAPIRGDADPTDGKETGSFESRSKKALYALATERGLAVNSKTSKVGLVKALRRAE